MKKFAAWIVIVAVAALFAGICAAAESQKYSTKQKDAMVDRNGDGRIDGVDIYDESGKVVKRGYDTDNDMKVDNWETYDGNTGLPIVTQSDKAYLLQ